MPQIDYYFVTISPWTYLAGSRLEQIAEKHGATVTYKPCDINSVFRSTGGLPLAERAQARKDYRVQELKRWRAALGMELTLQPAHFPTNPAPSGYAIIAANVIGVGGFGNTYLVRINRYWHLHLLSQFLNNRSNTLTLYIRGYRICTWPSRFTTYI